MLRSQQRFTHRGAVVCRSASKFIFFIFFGPRILCFFTRSVGIDNFVYERLIMLRQVTLAAQAARARLPASRQSSARYGPVASGLMARRWAATAVAMKKEATLAQDPEAVSKQSCSPSAATYTVAI